MTDRWIIRTAEERDLPFVREMMYEAAAVAPSVQEMDPDAALALLELRKYVEEWGRSGDAAVVAEDPSGRRLGAAWYRLFPVDAPGYGFVSADVPELSIAVAPEARGRGVGGALLAALMDAARAQGCRALSLSVDRGNPARRLYERHGFRDAGVSGLEDSSVTLLAEL